MIYRQLLFVLPKFERIPTILVRMNYWPYLDAQLQLRSPDLAGVPEDVIGLGFWMWWPCIALLFTFALTSALSAAERRGRLAAILVSAFALLSAIDYYLCERLIEALLRG